MIMILGLLGQGIGDLDSGLTNMYNSVRSTLTIKEAFRNVTKQGGGVLEQVHVTKKRDRGFDLDFDQCLTIKTKLLTSFNK